MTARPPRPGPAAEHAHAWAMVCAELAVAARAGRMPPSWAADFDPPAGAPCGCCGSARYWQRRAAPRGGWCCGTCHPPDGIDDAAVRRAATTENA